MRAPTWAREVDVSVVTVRRLPPEPAQRSAAGDLGEATARSAKREDGWDGGINPNAEHSASLWAGATAGPLTDVARSGTEAPNISRVSSIVAVLVKRARAR
jgi:hypothetical protein